MFDGIRKLLAGYILTCNKENSQIKQYWDIVFSESGILNEDYYKNKFLQLLKDSIRRRLISDVPFGAFLSGGTDSSLVVALMSEILENPVETFSVGYNEKEYSELRYARNIAEKYDTNHHELVIDADDVVNILPEFVWHEDEPSLMESSVAFFLLSKCAKKYVTVALCGEGSDELFAGYYSYLWEIYDRFDVFSKSIPKFLKDRFIPLIKNFRRLRYLPVEDTYFGSGTSFSEEQKQELYNDSTKDKVRGYSPHVTISKFKNRMTKLSDLNKMIYIDVKTWLPDCLLMNEDKMGMAASIESRIPFLDYRVVEFAATIPDKIKLKNGILKYVVKKVAYDYVPKENIDRAKMGFSTPVSFWFREDLFDIISQILLDKKTITRDYFNSNEIEKLLFDHKNKKFNNAHKIWQLLNMEIWHRIYIDNDDLSNPNLRLEKYM
jgi:asparagine synthase (glutamine-hydrolysing)